MNLYVMLLAHRRPQLLAAICDQAHLLGAHIHLTLDRPSPAVLEVATHLHDLGLCHLHHATEPALTLRGENFMPVRREQFHRLAAAPGDWACIWDDDHVLEDPAEHATLLARPDLDLIYATKRYLWGSLDTEAAHLFTHRSPLWFRVRAGDDYPLDRMIHAPADVHDHPRATADLQSRLLDIGYLTAPERLRVWTAYKRAGKIDRATLGLVEHPTLVPYTADTPGHRLLKDALTLDAVT